MANCTLVPLLFRHLDIKINNLVTKVETFKVFIVGNWENTESKFSETFPCNFLYKLFQGVLQAKDTLLSFCMGEKKAFFLSSLILKHRNLKISK